MRFFLRLASSTLLSFTMATCFAQTTPAQKETAPSPWHDPSPHAVQFVTVDKDVKLEVLDWGGTGRPVVLLAGLGNTAHVFDDFAPKLTPQFHVYGITRRGFGASSAPAPTQENYSADRLGDDVLAVLDALKLEKPVLVGHSIAGEELSSIGSRHPERIAGLVYLDAGYGYAYYDQSRGYYTIDSDELETNLDEMRNGILGPAKYANLIHDLLETSLPRIEQDVKEMQVDFEARPKTPGPVPGPADLESFSALHAWMARVQGVDIPESELRQTSDSTPDGKVGKRNTSLTVPVAIYRGERKYTEIRTGVLAIFASPHHLGPWLDDNPAARAAFEARDAATTEAQAKAFEKGVPSARVVRLPHANHYVFLSNEADVLGEMRAFLRTLS